jgi:hypothetical protein
MGNEKFEGKQFFFFFFTKRKTHKKKQVEKIFLKIWVQMQPV